MSGCVEILSRACGGPGTVEGRYNVKYKATERQWVMRLLARLTPAQRVRYESEMARQPGHYRSGKKYDGLKAKVAERILYADSRKAAP